MPLCCIRYVKDTILKAIYNRVGIESKIRPAVFDMSKIQFWKQFTTVHVDIGDRMGLYSICQRYNFESNLQPFAAIWKKEWGCIRYVKDTILKAIYNALRRDNHLSAAVFDMSKIQFWKQFTTVDTHYRIREQLYSICQRYNFESNLQHICLHAYLCYSCIRYVKDTILEANSQHVYMHVCILEWNIPFYLKTNQF